MNHSSNQEMHSNQCSLVLVSMHDKNIRKFGKQITAKRRKNARVEETTEKSDFSVPIIH